MLSDTNEINDIKKLIQSYSEYGLDNEDALTSIIEDCIMVVMNNNMLSILSETTYSDLAAKDKENLDREEQLIYEAEVRFSAAEFLNRMGMLEHQKKDTESKSVSFGGISFSYNGIPSKYRVASILINDAFRMLSQAGYKRTLSIGRNGLSNNFDNNYIYTR